MKTLEEIKEEYAKEQQFDYWDELLNYWVSEDIHECNNQINEAMKRYADECAKEALRLASEGLIEWSYERHPNFRTAREAILSENNLPKHR